MLRCLKTNLDFYKIAKMLNKTKCEKKAVQFQPQPYIFCGHAKLVV